MRKPLPTTLAAALALALAAPLAFSQSTAPRATVTNVTPTNGSTVTTSGGAAASTGTGVSPNAIPSLRPAPVTNEVSPGTTSISRTGTTANTGTTGTSGSTTTASGTPTTAADGSTQVLTRDQFVGAAAGRGDSVPIPQDAGPGRALTHEEEQALRDRLRAERSLANAPGNGNGMIVMSPGTPQSRAMTVTSPEQDRAARRAAQRAKAVARNGQFNNMIVPRTDNDRTNQMPDDPIVRY